MSEVTIDESAVAQVELAKGDIVLSAETFQITCPADLEMAAYLIEVGNKLTKEIDGLFKEPKQKAHEAHKSITGLWNDLRNPVVAAVKQIKAVVGQHHDEIRRKADAERREAAAKAAKIEEDRRIAAAIAFEKRGEQEKAEQLINAPAPPPSAPVISAPPPVKVKGISTRVVYTGRVTDPASFLGWCLEKGRFEEFYQLDQSALDAMLQKAEGDIDIMGLEVHSQTVVKQGGKR